MSASKVVLGLGNLLNRDEGFGVLAIQALRADPELCDRYEWADGGVLGMNLLPLVESCERLLVLDAIDSGQAAGTVIELDREQIPLYAHARLSEHQVGFQEVLGLARFRDRLPGDLHLIGVQPQDMRLGIGLSEPVSMAMPEVIKRATHWLKEGHSG